MTRNNCAVIYLICIIIIALLIYYIKSITDKKENFNYLNQKAGNPPKEPENDFKSEGGSYKELERDTGKIKPAEGSCKSYTDPQQLCLTYDSCCQGGGSNCLCQNPVIKDCVSMYEECINDQYLSEKNMSYLGNPNKHKVCKNILKNCCNVVKDIKIDANYQQVKMKYGDTNDEICNIPEATPEMCRNLCNLNEKCTGYIFSKPNKDCYVYSGSFKDKREAYAKGDKNYLQYVKEGFTSGNNNNKNNNNNSKKGLDGMGVCKKYQELCSDSSKLSGNKNACICNHSITQDCKKQYDKCLKKPISGLSKKLKKAYCQNMFGACCQAINNIDVSERFKYEEPIGGNGISSNLICFDENSGLNLQECQKRCTNNPDCTFIDTNTALSSDEREDNPLFCGLYKGSPSSYSSGSTMKKQSLGKTIYKKKEITEKDKIKEELDIGE